MKYSKKTSGNWLETLMKPVFVNLPGILQNWRLTESETDLWSGVR